MPCLHSKPLSVCLVMELYNSVERQSPHDVGKTCAACIADLQKFEWLISIPDVIEVSL